MKKFLLLVFSCCFLIFLNAQIEFNNYKSQKCQGKIPKSFLSSTTTKANSEIAKINSKEKRKTKKRKESFYLQSSYFIDDLLKGGKVLFGDPLSEYVTKVAKEVLKDDKTTFNKLQFYVVKSPAVNAFATQQGIIFLNMGLLAKLESEAELAFVLAHEISHFTEEHVLDSYIQSEDIEENYKKGKTVSYDDALLTKSNYSKAKELEADQLGFKTYQKSDYNQKSVLNVFQRLREAHLPFMVLDFDPTFISTDNYFLNNNIDFDLEEEIKKSKKKRKKRNRRNDDDDDDDDDDEKYATHPGTDERIEKLEDDLDSGGELFLVSEEEFYEVQRIARYELSELLYDNGSYEYCIYNNFLLAEMYENGQYLQKLNAFALNKLVKIKNYEQKRGIYYENIPEGVVKIYFLLENIKDKDLALLAANYTNFALKNNPEDLALKELWDDSLFEVAHHYKDFDTFEKDPNYKKRKRTKKIVAQVKNKSVDEMSIEELEAQLLSIEMELTDNSAQEKELEEEEKEKEEAKKSNKKYNSKSKSKYNKAKATVKNTGYESKILTSENKYAFTDLMDVPGFKAKFEKAVDKRERYDNWVKEYEEKQKSRKNRRNVYRDSYALGIDKLIVVNTDYLKLDGVKAKKGQNPLQYKESEEARVQYREAIESISKKMNLELVMLDNEDFKSNEVFNFNALADIYFFMQERNANPDSPMISYKYNELKAISDKYGTTYFSFTGGIEVKYKAASNFDLFLAIFAFPLAFLTPKVKHANTIFTVVYDMEAGSRDFTSTRYFRKKNKSVFLKSQLYDVYQQLNRKENSSKK